jgi:hypothetical protein
MIQRSPDGTLSYQDGSVIATIFDNNYEQLLNTESAQLIAATSNKTALNNYNVALANAQTSLNAGRPMAPPAKVQMLQVNDDGTSTYVDFNPPLAVLQPPPASTPSGSIAAQSIDKLDLCYKMLLALYNDKFGVKK